MQITCPACGKTVTINGYGRPKLNIPVKKVIDAFNSGLSMEETAKSLGCSRAHLYDVVRGAGKKIVRDKKTNRVKVEKTLEELRRLSYP